jgi:hypothetical protein
LFFIKVSTRQIVAAGVTAQPDSSWVTQQARNATMELNDRQLSTRFLLRDHDAKFSRAFDNVFRCLGSSVQRTPALTWSGVVMCSAASSTSITRSQHEEPAYLRPTGAARENGWTGRLLKTSSRCRQGLHQ